MVFARWISYYAGMGTANRSETTVILAAARTPVGRFNGALADIAAPALGGIAIRAALERSGVAPERIGQVVMGHVLPAGTGQNPARQAAVAGGIPMHVPSFAVNKVCLSGLTAIAIADRFLRAGDCDFVVAGGMESMSRAPHLLPQSRRGFKYGEVTMLDHAAFDGLTDAYEGIAMGAATERDAREAGLTRAAQDAFALARRRRPPRTPPRGPVRSRPSRLAGAWWTPMRVLGNRRLKPLRRCGLHSRKAGCSHPGTPRR
jgi:acetyl-CoA C-acetyltransferase